jgi:hypothetical protein
MSDKEPVEIAWNDICIYKKGRVCERFGTHVNMQLRIFNPVPTVTYALPLKHSGIESAN